MSPYKFDHLQSHTPSCNKQTGPENTQRIHDVLLLSDCGRDFGLRLHRCFCLLFVCAEKPSPNLDE